MRTYSASDHALIAEAVGLNSEAVHRFAKEFEAAAMWYRLDSASPRRATTTELKRRLTSMTGHARKLLKALGIQDPRDAMNGPQDFELLAYLTEAGMREEHEVSRATARIGRLVEIIEAAEAAINLQAWADEAKQSFAESRRLFALPGHQGDIATNDWIAAMMGIYEKLTGNPPKTSVGAVGEQARKASGPLMRFLGTAGSPLGIELTPDAWRERVRAILRHSPAQK